ncbi:MAG: hypothetical protein ABSE22_24115 [Xanthobacteraceae bacterium]|jgi:hypothetical protein
MSVKTLIAIMALAALPLMLTAPQAAAQNDAPQRQARQRIEINPRPLLYRRCTDWYELQNRPSGTVLYPQMRCWWVRG